LRIALIGFMGSGKSTVGRLLGEVLHVPFVDLDTHIENTAQQTVSDIFHQFGEQGFRTMERQALREVSVIPACVCATGGGTVVCEESRTLLAAHFTTILLDVQPETVVERVGQDGSRPLLSGEVDVKTRVEALMNARKNDYERLSNYRCTVDGRSPILIVEEIKEYIEGLHSDMRERRT